MAITRLTGSRIRERRLARCVRQVEVAREVGISAAYLNLIEHNRRRIGGKLLVDLAGALDCEPSLLSEGAEGALIASLRDAADRAAGAGAEGEPAEDFAGRFPGWAQIVAEQGRRIGELERLAETLSDRLAHDPHLAASLHEVLSAVTAIRSAASILREPGIDRDWQVRFLRNVGEESRRLSESAEGLVAYLDGGADNAETPLSPVDELSAFVARSQYQYDSLEKPGAGEADIDRALDEAERPRDPATAELVRAMLSRYLRDTRAMPGAAFRASRAASGDLARLAAAFGVGLDAVLRRAASLAGEGAGLVTCDGSGTLILKKPVAGFDLPRFGAGCPLWPLFQSLARPSQPVVALVEMPGRMPRRFMCHAVSLPAAGTGIGAPSVFEATMLIEPTGDDDEHPVGTPVVKAGSTCRVCPREHCDARREPSILGDRAPQDPAH